MRTMLKDSENTYGLISLILHWVMAILIIGLFILGAYMVTLNYNDAWFHEAPDIHRSLGVLTGILLIVRIIWRQINPRPVHLGTDWEKSLGRKVHALFYILLLVIIISGYLITSADGMPVAVFNWFQIPATITSLYDQADKAGWVHKIIAYVVMSLVVLHAAASLKHHFINRDATLSRMLGKNQRKTSITAKKENHNAQ